MNRILLAATLAFCFTASAHDVADHREHQSQLNTLPNQLADGLELSPNFPIELFLDRGRLLGCIFDSKFFSLGSILIEESLPRKCELGPARTGVWQELTDIEMALYLEQLEKQQATEGDDNNETLLVADKPLTETEIRLVRLFRISQLQEQRKNNR